MKNTALSAVGLAALTAAPLAPSTSALAAPTGSPAGQPVTAVTTDPDWNAPEFTLVGGIRVIDGVGGTDVRTPRFSIVGDQAGHDGASFVVRDSETKSVVCESDDGNDVPGTGTYYNCDTGTVLPRGRSHYEAVLVSADGKTESQAAALELVVVAERSEILVTGYDATKDVVKLAGTGPAGLTVDISQDLDFVEGSVTTVDVDREGKWAVSLTNPFDEGFYVRATINGHQWRSATYFNKNGPVTPTETHYIENGRLIIDVGTEAKADRIVVAGAADKPIASSPRTGDVTRFSLPAPTGRAGYQIHAYAGAEGSPVAGFVVNENDPIDLTDPPQVNDVTRLGERAVVTADAAPGATVTIRDENGSVRGMRVANFGGHVQVVVPAPASRVDARYSITQTKNDAVSDRAVVVVPAS